MLTRSAGAVANALDKLVSLGVAQMVTDKPRTYRLAAAPASAPGAAGRAVCACTCRVPGMDPSPASPHDPPGVESRCI